VRTGPRLLRRAVRDGSATGAMRPRSPPGLVSRNAGRNVFETKYQWNGAAAPAAAVATRPGRGDAVRVPASGGGQLHSVPEVSAGGLVTAGSPPASANAESATTSPCRRLTGIRATTRAIS
jgi:hypothetical protein